LKVEAEAEDEEDEDEEEEGAMPRRRSLSRRKPEISST